MSIRMRRYSPETIFMQLIQLYMNHCLVVQELFTHAVRDLKTDVALLSETYRVNPCGKWVSDQKGKDTISTAVIGAFRTISDDAAIVIAGLVFLDELVLKKDARRSSLDNWQNAWDNSSKGR